MLYCFWSRQGVLKNHDVIIPSNWMLLIFLILNFQTLHTKSLWFCMEIQFCISPVRKKKGWGCKKQCIFWWQTIRRPNENIFYKSAICRVLHRFSKAADVSFPRLSLCRSKTGRYFYCLYYVRYSGMRSYSCTE